MNFCNVATLPVYDLHPARTGDSSSHVVRTSRAN
jgi:hypothetical protein